MKPSFRKPFMKKLTRGAQLTASGINSLWLPPFVHGDHLSQSSRPLRSGIGPGFPIGPIEYYLTDSSGVDPLTWQAKACSFLQVGGRTVDVTTPPVRDEIYWQTLRGLYQLWPFPLATMVPFTQFSKTTLLNSFAFPELGAGDLLRLA